MPMWPANSCQKQHLLTIALRQNYLVMHTPLVSCRSSRRSPLLHEQSVFEVKSLRHIFNLLLSRSCFSKGTPVSVLQLVCLSHFANAASARSTGFVWDRVTTQTGKASPLIFSRIVQPYYMLLQNL